jgi:hypothetical protein
VSETTKPTPTTTPDAGAATPEERPSSFPARLMYAVYGAMQADLGCLIGAIFWFALMAGSYFFAAQLTPCTSAGGIPCAP